MMNFMRPMGMAMGRAMRPMGLAAGLTRRPMQQQNPGMGGGILSAMRNKFGGGVGMAPSTGAMPQTDAQSLAPEPILGGPTPDIMQKMLQGMGGNRMMQPQDPYRMRIGGRMGSGGPV